MTPAAGVTLYGDEWSWVTWSRMWSKVTPVDAGSSWAVRRTSRSWAR